MREKTLGANSKMDDFYRIKEINELCGRVQLLATQTILGIDVPLEAG